MKCSGAAEVFDPRGDQAPELRSSNLGPDPGRRHTANPLVEAAQTRRCDAVKAFPRARGIMVNGCGVIESGSYAADCIKNGEQLAGIWLFAHRRSIILLNNHF